MDDAIETKPRSILRSLLGVLRKLLVNRVTLKLGEWLAISGLSMCALIGTLDKYEQLDAQALLDAQIEKIIFVKMYRGWQKYEAAQAMELAKDKEDTDDLLVSQRKRYTREELEQIVRISAKRFGVPEEISLAFVDHESNWDVVAFRHEPHHMNKPACSRYRNQERRRSCAGSHGLYQIMFSVWHKQCELNSFAELYDPRVNAACGNYILSKILGATAHIKQLDKRLVAMMRQYNGVNMPPVYAQKVMSAMGRRMFASVVPAEERKDVLRASLEVPFEPEIQRVEVADVPQKLRRADYDDEPGTNLAALGNVEQQFEEVQEKQEVERGLWSKIFGG